MHGADLSRAILLGADLSDADLRWTNLRGAELDHTTQIADKWQLAWEIIEE